MRYLQPTELGTLLDASPEWLQPIVMLAAFSGMRRGEILGHRWLDIDLRNHRVLLPQTKNGEGHVVYLNRSAEAVFEALARPDVNGVSRVFAGHEANAVSIGSCARRMSNISDFRFHDLHHTEASWMRMQGADIHTVAQFVRAPRLENGDPLPAPESGHAFNGGEQSRRARRASASP